MQGGKVSTTMSLEEKQYMTNTIDNHLLLLQNSINSNKSLQFNTAFLIGTILIGTFGVILLGFLKTPAFSFSTQETNLAVMVFVLSSISYFVYSIITIFLGIKRVKKEAGEYKKKVEIFGNIKIYSIHNLMKPLLSMALLSTVSTLFLINSIKEHYYLFPLLIFAMAFFSAEITIIYVFIKKLFKRIKVIDIIRYSLLILPHLEKMTFLAVLRKGVTGKIISSYKESDFYEKFKFFSGIIFLFLLVLILLLPITISFFIPIYYLFVSFHTSNITWVLIVLVLVLQFILLYPLKKYFKHEVEIETFKEFYNQLDILRKIILFDANLTFQNAMKGYYKILTEFPYACY